MARSRKRGIKGAGSVYQRKSDGRWVGSFKTEEMSTRKYVYAPVDNNTQKAAYDLLQKAIREQEQGTLATGPSQSMKDYLTYWLEKVHKPTIYITTYVRCCNLVYDHLIPVLGHVSLRKLTTQQVQTLVAGKIDEGLAPGTISKIYCVLHSALDHAVKLKLVSRNVSEGVTLPKIPKHKSQILTKEQLQKLLEVADARDIGAFVKLGLMSGMRHGEMLALRWADINFETGVLSVVHNVGRVPGQGFVEGDPKTEDGIRKIILPQFVLDVLEIHREQQEERRKLAGDKWKEHDLVFCSRTGGYTCQDVSLARFRRVLVEADLPPKMRIHDLRHNVATFLINVLHYPPTLVQALLGHSDVAITMRLYVDNDPEMLRPMMNDLNALFGGESEILQAPGLRRTMIRFLANALKYPPNVVHALLDDDPEALRRMMDDLNNLFGGK